MFKRVLCLLIILNCMVSIIPLFVLWNYCISIMFNIFNFVIILSFYNTVLEAPKYSKSETFSFFDLDAITQGKLPSVFDFIKSPFVKKVLAATWLTYTIHIFYTLVVVVDKKFLLLNITMTAILSIFVNISNIIFWQKNK